MRGGSRPMGISKFSAWGRSGNRGYQLSTSERHFREAAIGVDKSGPALPARAALTRSVLEATASCHAGALSEAAMSTTSLPLAAPALMVR
jgi:hypothetical protein